MLLTITLALEFCACAPEGQRASPSAAEFRSRAAVEPAAKTRARNVDASPGRMWRATQEGSGGAEAQVVQLQWLGRFLRFLHFVSASGCFSTTLPGACSSMSCSGYFDFGLWWESNGSSPGRGWEWRGSYWWWGRASMGRGGDVKANRVVLTAGGMRDWGARSEWVERQSAAGQLLTTPLGVGPSRGVGWAVAGSMEQWVALLPRHRHKGFLLCGEGSLPPGLWVLSLEIPLAISPPTPAPPGTRVHHDSDSPTTSPVAHIPPVLEPGLNMRFQGDQG